MIRSILFLIPLFFLFSCSAKLECPKSISADIPPTGQTPPWKAGSFDLPTDRPMDGRSAFFSLSDPADAYAARLHLVDHAVRSLDLQYYIFKDDRSGNYLLYRLLAAAERGVRVRILLDDLTTTGVDREWAILTCHPNIEIRIFNPNPWRRLFRNVALLLNIETLGKRMHNKALVADGRAAIIGGRNIGDEYFIRNGPLMFIDYDIIAIGSIVPEISNAFGIYWRSDEARAAKEVLTGRFTREDLNASLAKFLDRIRRFEHTDAYRQIGRSSFYRRLGEKTLRLTVADKAWFYYDLPQKVSQSETNTTTHLSSRIREDIESARKEIVIVSPYFIPSGPMLEKLKSERERGVEITIVTNSLASTDVAVVYSGYRKYIRPLLEMGVRLYEVKPVPLEETKLSRAERREQRMSLHTKMILIDDNRLVVGSANIDPRSVKLNTEYLLEIENKKIVREIREVLSEEIDERYLYRLAWERYPTWAANGEEAYYGVVWVTKEKGKTVRYYRPPNVGFFKRLGVALFGLLPIEGQL